MRQSFPFSWGRERLLKGQRWKDTGQEKWEAVRPWFSPEALFSVRGKPGERVTESGCKEGAKGTEKEGIFFPSCLLLRFFFTSPAPVFFFLSSDFHCFTWEIFFPSPESSGWKFSPVLSFFPSSCTDGSERKNTLHFCPDFVLSFLATLFTSPDFSLTHNGWKAKRLSWNLLNWFEKEVKFFRDFDLKV